MLFILALVLQACSGSGKPGYWVNNQIDSGKREELHKLNNQVFKDIKTEDHLHLKSMLSKELLDKSYLYRQVATISSYLNKNDYTLFKEYYVVNKWRDEDTIKAQGSGINSYSLYYTGLAKEMYMVFYLPKTGISKKMITASYCKYDYGWKLAKLDLELYCMNGKTAPELYNMAKDKMQKNYLSDAVSTMELAYNCLTPSYVWKYPEDSLMRDFNNKLVEQANEKFTFPFMIRELPTHPQIFRVFNQKMPDDVYYPMIYYISSIPLKDTAAVRRENTALKKVIGKVIPGIDKEKKYLYYGAFNQLPSIKVAVDHIDFTDKLQ